MSTKTNEETARPFTTRRRSSHGVESVTELAVVEEPFEIRILHWFKEVPKVDSLTVLMRTPGFDRELTAGYLFGESIIKHRRQLLNLHPLGDPASSNEYLAELSRDVDLDSQASHTRFVNSSCMHCDKGGIAAIPEPWVTPLPDAPRFDAQTILRLRSLVLARSMEPSALSGLSTAALFSAGGALEAAFDDVTPANALHKLLGHCFLVEQALTDRAIFLNRDSSFELVLKTIAAGCPILLALGAPSSLAIEAARARQLTLIGMVSETEFRVYAGESRIS